jgi:Rrf2 family transcriptional regulator, cysteine metabolism repressor
MKFSTREQYGLRAMAELARAYGGAPVSLSDVARAEGLSLSYLEQIIGSLRRAGLLESHRGAYGGYVLAHPPADISAGDVIRALEGAVIQLPCISDGKASPCTREDSCVTRSVWVEVRRKLVDTLDSMTLADLIGEESQAACARPLEELLEVPVGASPGADLRQGERDNANDA